MPPIPTPSSRELLQRVKKFIPPLLEKMHKGQQGRVAVIGGSEEFYTGAPFFSASASALLGADLSHVICEPQAAQVIKTYSPNLMVHPYMRQSQHKEENAGFQESIDEIVVKISALLDRLHAIVIGPGLGRDSLMQETAGKIIQEARNRGMGLVIDADGLLLIERKPSLIHGYKNVILTPNVVEFARLCKAVKIDPSDGDPTQVCAKLAKKLGGVTVVQKGQKDYISNGERTIVCDIRGGLKRSGGQGDTLTGSLVTFLAWKKAYQDRVWDHDNSLSDSELLALSAFGGAAITRICSRLAFEKKGRSLQASDLSLEVGNAFNYLFEGEDPKL